MQKTDIIIILNIISYSQPFTLEKCSHVDQNRPNIGNQTAYFDIGPFFLIKKKTIQRLGGKEFLHPRPQTAVISTSATI